MRVDTAVNDAGGTVVIKSTKTHQARWLAIDKATLMMLPFARNEFICWIEDAKQHVTRERRIRRTGEELEEGKRRPCCWPGCTHRERNGHA